MPRSDGSELGVVVPTELLEDAGKSATEALDCALTTWDVFQVVEITTEMSRTTTVALVCPPEG